MFEIPSDLNPALVGLAWLRGRWEGTGYRQWPGEEKTSYSIQIDFADNGGDYTDGRNGDDSIRGRRNKDN